MQVGSATPACDQDRDEGALGDELRDRGHCADRRDAEVVGEAAKRPDAVCARRDLDECPHRVGVGRLRPAQHLGGQNPLGQVVAAFECGVATRRHELAREEQVLKNSFRDAPVPAPLGAGAWVDRVVDRVDLAGGHRSVGGFRASIYNAMELDGIDALVQVMKDFAKKNG